MGEDDAHHRCTLSIDQAILQEECDFNWNSSGKCFFNAVSERDIQRKCQLNQVEVKDSLSRIVLQAIFGNDYSSDDYNFGSQAYKELLKMMSLWTWLLIEWLRLQQ